MIAYKFLRAGQVGRFSGARWPEPGSWLRADSAAAGGPGGVSACRLRDLPWWLGEELWEIELADPVSTGSHKVIAPAGRLHARIERWTPELAVEYGESCGWHVRDLVVTALGAPGDAATARLAAATTTGEMGDAIAELLEIPVDVQWALDTLRTSAMIASSGGPAMMALISARVAGRIDPVSGYDDERAWQSRWLADRLGLPD